MIALVGWLAGWRRAVRVGDDGQLVGLGGFEIEGGWHGRFAGARSSKLEARSDRDWPRYLGEIKKGHADAAAFQVAGTTAVGRSPYSIGWTGCAGELAPVRDTYNVLQAVGRP
jgi:hypothetical protein